MDIGVWGPGRGWVFGRGWRYEGRKVGFWGGSGMVARRRGFGMVGWLGVLIARGREEMLILIV